MDIILYGPDRTKFPFSVVSLKDGEIPVQDLHINLRKRSNAFHVSADAIYRDIIFSIDINECISDIIKHINYMIQPNDREHAAQELEQLWHTVFERLADYVHDNQSNLTYKQLNDNPDSLKGHVTNII